MSPGQQCANPVVCGAAWPAESWLGLLTHVLPAPGSHVAAPGHARHLMSTPITHTYLVLSFHTATPALPDPWYQGLWIQRKEEHGGSVSSAPGTQRAEVGAGLETPSRRQLFPALAFLGAVLWDG